MLYYTHDIHRAFSLHYRYLSRHYFYTWGYVIEIFLLMGYKEEAEDYWDGSLWKVWNATSVGNKTHVFSSVLRGL